MPPLTRKTKKRPRRKPEAPAAPTAPAPVATDYFTSDRWRALVHGGKAGPVDPMHPDAGYYEARGGTRNKPFPLPARIVVTLHPDGTREVKGWVDGARVPDVISVWLYWRPITLERYDSLKKQENKEGPGQRSDLKWQKPII